MKYLINIFPLEKDSAVYTYVTFIQIQCPYISTGIMILKYWTKKSYTNNNIRNALLAFSVGINLLNVYLGRCKLIGKVLLTEGPAEKKMEPMLA